MKKIVLFLSVVGFLTTSCADKNEYIIKGKVPASVENNSVVYLEQLNDDWKGRTKIDSAVVLEGAFRFEGVAAEKPQLVFVTLSTQTDDMKAVSLFIEPGNIEVDYNAKPVVKGSPSNDKLRTLTDKSILFADNGRLMLAESNAPDSEVLDAFKSYVKENIGNEMTDYYFVRNAYLFEYNELKELVPALTKDNEYVNGLKKQIETLAATQPDQIFTDLKGKSPKGVDVALSDYVGKSEVVLVDFWASWCPPCREDMPAVVEMYKKYKSKGLEIVGVSIDHEVDKWEAGIKSLNVTWPQMSDLKGWSSELSGAYGVKSIPHTILINKEGKIIARGLEIKDLEKKLEELLK